MDEIHYSIRLLRNSFLSPSVPSSSISPSSKSLSSILPYPMFPTISYPIPSLNSYIKQPTVSCPPGTQLSGSYGSAKCITTTTCQQGNLNTQTGQCETASSAPVCPPDTQFITQNGGQCVTISSTNIICGPAQTLDTSNGQCVSFSDSLASICQVGYPIKSTTGPVVCAIEYTPTNRDCNEIYPDYDSKMDGNDINNPRMTICQSTKQPLATCKTGTLDERTGLCKETFSIQACPSEFTFSSQNGGTCIKITIVSTAKCTTGILDSSVGRCMVITSSSACPQNTIFNSSTGKCETKPTVSCPSGTALNVLNRLCIRV